MANKKTPPTLSILQSGIEELQITLKSLVRQINDRFNKVDNTFSKLEIRMDKRFNEQDDKFVAWKNELFTKIDNSYAKPIKDLQDEDAAAEFKLEDHEDRISKLEKSGKFLAA